MIDLSQIQEQSEVIGADGVHVGIVDHVEGRRIKLTKTDDESNKYTSQHRYISGGLIASVHSNVVRLSANADVAITFEEDV